MNDDIFEPIRRAIYSERHAGKTVTKIHITFDFKLRVKAAMPILAITTNPKELNADEILGYPVEVHDEKTDRVWWLEAQ